MLTLLPFKVKNLKIKILVPKNLSTIKSSTYSDSNFEWLQLTGTIFRFKHNFKRQISSVRVELSKIDKNKLTKFHLQKKIRSIDHTLFFLNLSGTSTKSSLSGYSSKRANSRPLPTESSEVRWLRKRSLIAHVSLSISKSATILS